MADNGKKKPEGDDPRSRFSFNWPAIALVGLLAVAMTLVFFVNNSAESVITYSFFEEQLLKHNIESVTIQDSAARGVFKNPPPAPSFINAKGDRVDPPLENGKPRLLKKFYRVVLVDSADARSQLANTIDKLNADRAARGEPKIQFDNQPSQSVASVFYFFSFMLLAMVLLGMYLTARRNRDPLGAGGIMGNFTRSTARKYEGKQAPITFADVAGLEGVKADLQEIVDFLKAPEKFRKLGGRVPKGVLLNGPPGTGKTLLARAIAGEAGAPFFSVNGSEFIQLFVGVGASRVRDLFQQAKAVAPAIVFIDEIDAVGRHRGAGLGGGHDEREQTLNQLLVEMDGFDVKGGVILIAATNRPDILDPALLRPGRFDRQIVIDRPDLEGRKGILRVHARGKPFAPEVDLDTIARRTPGFTGADLANVINEAALLTARKDEKLITQATLEEAIDRVMAGPERKSRVMSDQEKKIIAYHEGGHALVAHALPNADPVHKITILSRGRALGYTMTLPMEDKFLATRSEMMDQLAMLLGGRTAEELVFHEPTTGAANDIEKATQLARRMVTEYGMSEQLGARKFGSGSSEVFLGRDMGHERDYSEKIASAIDEEVRRLIETAHDRAWEILVEYRDVLDNLVLELMEKETLSREEVLRIFAPVRKREHRPSYLGYGKRLPSDRPPVLTPKERAGNGSGPALPSGGPNGGPSGGPSADQSLLSERAPKDEA